MFEGLAAGRAPWGGRHVRLINRELIIEISGAKEAPWGRVWEEKR